MEILVFFYWKTYEVSRDNCLCWLAYLSFLSLSNVHHLCTSWKTLVVCILHALCTCDVCEKLLICLICTANCLLLSGYSSALSFY